MTMPDVLNQMSEEDVSVALRRCCASEGWVRRMSARRPFADEATLYRTATAVWRGLDRAEWLAAFAGHPRIGGVDALRARFQTTRSWSQSEQTGVASADDGILQALADGNRRYEERFGFIFIVCASGKSAAEMLELLQSRLDNDPDTEIRIAASEQEKIMHLRLQKLLSKNPTV